MKDINDQWLLILVIMLVVVVVLLLLLLVVVVYMCFLSFDYDGVKLFFPVFYCIQLTSLDWRFPSSTFCRADFVDRYTVIQSLLGIVL